MAGRQGHPWGPPGGAPKVLLKTLKGKEPFSSAGAAVKNGRCLFGSGFIRIVSLCILNGELNVARASAENVQYFSAKATNVCLCQNVLAFSSD